MNETMKSLLERRSCRKFSSEQLKESEINDILEAAKYAPSGLNLQTWHFSVIQNQELINKIVLATKEFYLNSRNSKMVSIAENPNFHNFHHAPTVIIVSGSNKPLSEANCANTTTNMCLAAHSMGIGSCYIASYALPLNSGNYDDLKKEIGIPDDYKAYFSVAMGYPKGPSGKAAPRKDNVVNWVK